MEKNLAFTLNLNLNISIKELSDIIKLITDNQETLKKILSQLLSQYSD